MKSFRIVTCSLLLWTALVWLPSSNGAERPVEFKKNVSVPLGCGCSPQDETDLNSRIKQVEAAMKEYDSLIKEWEAKEKGSKEPLLLTSANRGSVQGSVGFRMSTVRTSNARSFKAETDPSCATTIEPTATPCLRGALQDHESVHKKACDTNKSSNPFVDWRDKQRVVDYMKEEKAGYQKERDRLQDEVNKMQAFCSLDPSTRQILQQTAAQQDNEKKAVKDLESYTTHLD
jgi:hypothetical protein